MNAGRALVFASVPLFVTALALLIVPRLNDEQTPPPQNALSQPGLRVAPREGVMPLGLGPGDELVLHGLVYTPVDGTEIDAITQKTGSGEPRLGGYFDIDAGGLRLVSQDPAKHTYKLVARDGVFPGCSAHGVSSPCLVPRLRDLAHERLVAEDEFARGLVGAFDTEMSLAPAPPAPPLVSRSEARTATFFGAGAFLLAAAALILSLVLARRSTPIGQVRAAAKKARLATTKDPTLAEAHRRIDALVTRAEALEGAREACAARLAKIDRRALDVKRATLARAGDAESREALTWLETEAAEVHRLESDLASSVTGLERIAASLRVVALASRKHRGTRARIEEGDPVDALADELRLRDEAIAETDELLARVRRAS